MDEFRKELADLLNRYELDGKCNTPAWILAIYLESCIVAFEASMDYRDGMSQTDDTNDVCQPVAEE